MNILVADKVSSKVLDGLKALGARVEYAPDLNDETLGSRMKETEVLIVRSTKVKAAAIEAAPLLSLIVRAGAGVNTIDVAKAAERGIAVANCPGRNNDAVAELALGLLIAADRRIPDATTALRNGQWKKGEFGKSRGLKGRTLGIIGLGSIGFGLTTRAMALGMKVIAWSRSLTPEKAEALNVEYCASPAELASKSDAISVHLSMSRETKGLLNKAFFDAMKPGAIFINTARGEVVDTPALLAAVKEKKIRAGLDVFENEPSGSDAPFTGQETAALAAAATPHIGASTDQAEEAIGEEALRIVKTYFETGKAINAVNIRKKSPGINLVVRHYNHVGVLAGVLDLLRNEGINIEEMENTIFESGTAAACTLSLDKTPSEETLGEVRKDKNVIQVLLKA